MATLLITLIESRGGMGSWFQEKGMDTGQADTRCPSTNNLDRWTFPG